MTDTFARPLRALLSQRWLRRVRTGWQRVEDESDHPALVPALVRFLGYRRARSGAPTALRRAG